MVAKSAPSSPKYIQLIKEAIKAIKDRKGASRQAILKHIETTHKISAEKAKNPVRSALKRGVEKNELKLNGVRFRIVEKAAAPKKKVAKKSAKKAVKKVAKKAAKPTAAKKAAAKKTTAKKASGPKKTSAKKATKPKAAKKVSSAKKATKPKKASKPTKKTA